MYIHHLTLYGFGRWKKKSFEFNQNSYFIQGNNESGKTTLLKAVLAAFYGLGTKKDKREQFFSWLSSEGLSSETGACFVQIEFSYAGKHYRLERKFGKTASSDKIKLMNTALAQDIALDKQEPGEYLFKLNRISFENLCYLGHQGAALSLSEDKNRELLEKLKSLGQEGNEESSLEKTRQQFQTFFEYLLSKSKTKGQLLLWSKRLEKVKKLKQAYIDRAQQEALYMEYLEKSSATLQEEEKKLHDTQHLLEQCTENHERYEKVFADQKEFSALYEKQVQQIKGLTEQAQNSRAILEQLDLKRKEHIQNQECWEAEHKQSVFNLENQLKTVESDRLNLLKEKSCFASWIFYLLLSFLAGGVFLLAWFIALPWLNLFSSVGLLSCLWKSFSCYRKTKADARTLQNLEQKKQYLQNTLEEKNNTGLAFREQQEAQLKALNAFLNERQNEIEKEQLHLNQEYALLEDLNKKLSKTVPIREEDGLLLKKEKERLSQALKAIQDTILTEQLNQHKWKTTLEVLPKLPYGIRDLAQAEKNIVQVLEELQTEYQKTKTLLSALERTKQFLAEQMSPKLLTKAGHLLKHLTQGRYEKLLLNQDLDVQVLCQEDGRYHALQVLSQGTIELIYFALRLALLNFFEEQAYGTKKEGDYVETTLHLPLFLDDSFVHLDDGRILKAFECLNHEPRQCFYLCKAPLSKNIQEQVHWQTLNV